MLDPPDVDRSRLQLVVGGEVAHVVAAEQGLPAEGRLVTIRVRVRVRVGVRVRVRVRIRVRVRVRVSGGGSPAGPPT